MVFRHCEPTGRANARPMRGSAKQSIAHRKASMDCFVAFAARNNGRHTSAPSRQVSPESCKISRPTEGRRECRTPGASAAACAVVVSTRVSHHGHAGNVRHSPHDGLRPLRALVSAKSVRMCERAVLAKPPVAGSEPVCARRPLEPVGERGTGPVSSSTRTVAWASSPDRARKGAG
jgi:hypothetical protein